MPLKKITIIRNFECLSDPDKRQKNYYIKLDDSLLYGTDLPITIEERVLLYAILLIALKQKSTQIEVDFDHLKIKLGIISDIYGLLSSLKCNNIIALGYRNLHEYKQVSKKVSKQCTFVPLPHLVDIWNSNCGQLSKVRGTTEKRNKLCNARLKENPSEEYWISVVKEISQNNFCLGRNDRGWKANFDWLLKPDTHLKVMEGNYRGKSDQINSNVETLKKYKENQNGSANQYLRKD